MRRNTIVFPRRKPVLRKFPAADLSGYFSSDDQFDKVYPLSIAMLAQRHWTPLSVSRKAVQFLATGDNVRILDIGAGVGKFCIAAAHFAPRAMFYGVEQRNRLLQHAEKAKEVSGVKNAQFIHANFTQLDFEAYDHFYFFNSFFENLDGTDKIDDSIDYSGELYNYYNRYLYRQLDQKPPGTRLVTYHSLENEIPPDFHVVDSHQNGLLKFWVKI